MLYIIAGASGCGKKFVLERMKKLRASLYDIKKMTDKEKPTDVALEKKDLTYGYNQQTIKNECGDFMYCYEGNWYGINISEIDRALMTGKSPIVIVRDYLTIYKLKERYPFAVLIYIHTALTGIKLKDRLEKLNIKDDMSVEERVEREKRDYNNMIKERDKYKLHFDGYIANNFDSTIDLQIQNILLSIQEIDYHRIFVAMPFSRQNDYMPAFVESAIDNAERLLRRYSQRFKIYRVDKSEQNYFATYSIHDRLNAQIKESNVVICDLSLNNPNVSYEYEEALNCNKPVITIARKNSFGANHRAPEIEIIYSPNDVAELTKLLTKKICSKYRIT